MSFQNNAIEIAEPEIKIPKPKIAEELTLLPDTEGQVTVHGFFKNRGEWPELIRIWSTTFLIANNSFHKSRLVHFENITLYPYWTPIEVGVTHRFTLIFTGLPKSCKTFDLVEEIPQAGGFEIRNILRNRTDVYQINFGE